MALTEIELARIKMVVGALCDRRSPAEVRDRLRVEYSIRNQDVLIHEVRQKWISYEPFPSSQDLATIVDVVDQDEHGCFFG